MRRVAVVLVILAITGACSDSNKKAGNDTTTTAVTMRVAGVDAIVRGSSVAADGLEVELDDNYFKPNEIIGPPGVTVTLTLTNEGKSTHNFTHGDAVNTDVAPGRSTTVKVTLPTSGDAAFFCKFHKDESGMAGVLRVAT